jgi:hypothetical protein
MYINVRVQDRAPTPVPKHGARFRVPVAWVVLPEPHSRQFVVVTLLVPPELDSLLMTLCVGGIHASGARCILDTVCWWWCDCLRRAPLYTRLGDSCENCRYCILNIHSWRPEHQWFYVCRRCRVGRICPSCNDTWPVWCLWCCVVADPMCHDRAFWTAARMTQRRRVLNGHHYLFRPNYVYSDTDSRSSPSD